MAAAIELFIGAAEQGQAVNRSGRTYRPSALRDLSGILRYHVAPELGDMPLREVGRRHVQALVDRLAEEDLSESRIRSVVSALRGLYGYAIDHGYAEFNPADGLVMPPSGGAPSSEEPTREEPTREEPTREEPTREENRRPTLVDRLDEAWAERPRWEDRPKRVDRRGLDDEPNQDDPPPRRDDARKAPKRPDRDRSAYEPIAVLPERLLSFALRLAFVLLIVVAIISLLQPA
jgi:Phage integrase, N-terminal SAM-like domain